MVANVAPAAVRLMNAARHVGITADDEAVGKERRRIVRQQLLYDLYAVGRIAVLAFRVQTTEAHAQAYSIAAALVCCTYCILFNQWQSLFRNSLQAPTGGIGASDS